MGPLGSMGADPSTGVLTPSAQTYYISRAAAHPGTLVIAEGTFVSPRASGIAEPRAGIWSAAQIAAWKGVVDGVHAAGSFVVLQLWALGRGASADVKAREGTGDVVSSSAVAIPAAEDGEGEGGTGEAATVVPRALREEEIEAYITEYTQAAVNAVQKAGFDGVELHGGNGSLIDQFTQDVVNQRTDAWGGSVAKRSRFALDITARIAAAIGAERVGFRVSPWSTYQGMGMASREATIAQFSHLLRGLRELRIAYFHLVESRIAGRSDVAAGEPLTPFIDLLSSSSPIVLAGGFTAKTARIAVDETYADRDVLIAFGRAFVTHPDLVLKIKDGSPLVE
jgi:NADPH2 dehydrogenase